MSKGLSEVADIGGHTIMRVRRADPLFDFSPPHLGFKGDSTKMLAIQELSSLRLYRWWLKILPLHGHREDVVAILSLSRKFFLYSLSPAQLEPGEAYGCILNPGRMFNCTYL